MLRQPFGHRTREPITGPEGVNTAYPNICHRNSPSVKLRSLFDVPRELIGLNHQLKGSRRI